MKMMNLFLVSLSLATSTALAATSLKCIPVKNGPIASINLEADSDGPVSAREIRFNVSPADPSLEYAVTGVDNKTLGAVTISGKSTSTGQSLGVFVFIVTTSDSTPNARLTTYSPGIGFNTLDFECREN